MILPKETYGLALLCVWEGAPEKLPAERPSRTQRNLSCTSDLGRKLYPRSRKVVQVRYQIRLWQLYSRELQRKTRKPSYIEKFYEVYGYGGVGVIVSVLTDKVNRSVAAIRELVKDFGGKMADSGSIMFKFKRAWVVNIKAMEPDKVNFLLLP